MGQLMDGKEGRTWHQGRTLALKVGECLSHRLVAAIVFCVSVTLFGIDFGASVVEEM